MIFKKYFWIRWLFGCLIFFGCKTKSEIQFISAAEKETIQKQKLARKQWLVQNLQNIEANLQSGDLIVREGNDFTSQSLRQLNRRNKTYSHIGILSRENESVVVYHIMGGEWNPDARIMREPLFNFISPSINNQFAIYSLNIESKRKAEIVQNAIDYQKKDIRFDMQFDISTEDRMYCAEFIFHCVQPALPYKKIPLSTIDNFKFVGVDDIFLIPEAERSLSCDFINTALLYSNQNTK